MVSGRLSLRLPAELERRLRRTCKIRGVRESEFVREALESHLNSLGEAGNAYDAAIASGLIGIAKGLPSDLSTNRKYMQGFGEGHKISEP